MVRVVVEVVSVVVGLAGVVSVVVVTSSVFWRRMKSGMRSRAARGSSKGHEGQPLARLSVVVAMAVAAPVTTVGVTRSVPTVAVASWRTGLAAAPLDCMAMGRTSNNATSGIMNALSAFLVLFVFIFSS